MYRSVLSAAVQGMEATMIRVEADISNGLPSFQMVGYLSGEVKEAQERVRTAIHNVGDRIPPKRITINLSPANVRKVGTAYDLPIAMAVLMGLYESPKELFLGTVFLGELSLDGSVEKVAGVLPMVIEAQKQGCTACVVPMENAREASYVQGIIVYPVSHISQLVGCLKGNNLLEYSIEQELDWEMKEEDTLDFSDVYGQELVKRAAEISVAGGHNFLMVGPPGAGKSMVAKRISTILPPMTMEERLEVSKVYSIRGMLDANEPLVLKRPFREVHHTVTKTALIGGGNCPKPGELSLASNGVLFLDELTEFPKSVLELLRQPLEEKVVRISRTRGSFTFPANVILCGAFNPCPCGNYPDLNRCSCTEQEIHRYLSKISQPFLDRIDVCIEIPKLEYKDLINRHMGESSKEIRDRICTARELQKERYEGTGIRLNSDIPVKQLENYCELDQKCKKLMEMAFQNLNLTARTYHKILRVARTIADLEHKKKINDKHIREAMGYRTIDKKYWGR